RAVDRNYFVNEEKGPEQGHAEEDAGDRPGKPAEEIEQGAGFEARFDDYIGDERAQTDADAGARKSQHKRILEGAHKDGVGKNAAPIIQSEGVLDAEEA